MSQGRKTCQRVPRFIVLLSALFFILGLFILWLISEVLHISELQPLHHQTEIPHDGRTVQDNAWLLNDRRQTGMSKYQHGDYQCDYLHAKGQGKSGTTYLKLLLHLIEETLCQHTNYRQSYHYLHSAYSICKDWTNGTAEWQFHSTNFHRHSLHDIEQILISQQRRKEQNDPNYSQYFMGFGMYDLWKSHRIRYCVVMTLRDPRNRMLSRINTMYRQKPNRSSISIADKNKIFLKEFNRRYLENTQIWWNKFSALERDNVMDWFLYFYEDIRQNPFGILQDMIWFAGYQAFIDQEMIQNILSETDIGKRKASADIINNGDICSFHSERILFEETKQRANQLMIDVLSRELIDKFNRTCLIG